MNTRRTRDLSKRPFTTIVPRRPTGPPSEFNAAARNLEQARQRAQCLPGFVGPVFQDSPARQKVRTHNDIDFILDIPVQLTVELGRTKIAIKNLLQLAQGSVVELDGLAGEPMDVLVNG